MFLKTKEKKYENPRERERERSYLGIRLNEDSESERRKNQNFLLSSHEWERKRIYICMYLWFEGSATRNPI